jgi:hypothetical protein
LLSGHSSRAVANTERERRAKIELFSSSLVIGSRSGCSDQLKEKLEETTGAGTQRSGSSQKPHFVRDGVAAGMPADKVRTVWVVRPWLLWPQ